MGGFGSVANEQVVVGSPNSPMRVKPKGDYANTGGAEALLGQYKQMNAMEMSKLSENDNALHYATGRVKEAQPQINGSAESADMVMPEPLHSDEPVRHPSGVHNSRGLDRY